MPNACFIDTNILLYTKDPAAPDKRRRALAWLDALASRDLAVISPQVMNESGRAVQEAANFFKLGVGDITVFQDELELPAAKVRVKVGGGIAGHNGLRSISSHIGNDYRRVRLGIGHPGIKELVHSHVLSDFAKSDRPWVEALCEAVADNAGLLATGKDSTFQNKVHLVLQAKGIFDKEDDEKQD